MKPSERIHEIAARRAVALNGGPGTTYSVTVSDILEYLDSSSREAGRAGEGEPTVEELEAPDPAWLIEREKPGFGPRYLCFDMLFDWGPHDRALRFTRREDAEAMLVMGADEAAEFSLGPAVVTEHEWVPHPVMKSSPSEHNPASALRTAGRGKDSERDSKNPRAIVDSDTAHVGAVDSKPELQGLITPGAGDAGSNPARDGAPGTPGATVGAIPTAGAMATALSRMSGLAICNACGGMGRVARPEYVGLCGDCRGRGAVTALSKSETPADPGGDDAKVREFSGIVFIDGCTTWDNDTNGAWKENMRDAFRFAKAIGAEENDRRWTYEFTELKEKLSAAETEIAAEHSLNIELIRDSHALRARAEKAEAAREEAERKVREIEGAVKP